ncbi:YtxH domain-containing protein [Winogradskyella maritima]|uniref:YtxH domain-containing protein n=1 Tax=Winogradskyella maritima TaxID=1517766 RepID=A0ABV8AIA8_9FLAO|nr:YtxH domain-containing protein [Winogradskyella maritima]
MIQFKGALVLGTLIGAGIGVLMAPDKGSVTRDKLTKEGVAVKDQLVSDLKEVKEDLSKATASRKEKINHEAGEFKVKASQKAEKAITFLEKQLAILKEKNKTLQHTT